MSRVGKFILSANCLILIYGWVNNIVSTKEHESIYLWIKNNNFKTETHAVNQNIASYAYLRMLTV